MAERGAILPPIVAAAAAVAAVVLGAALVALGGCTFPAGKLTLGIDAKSHAAYFPIVEGSKHALGTATPADGAIACESCHASTTTTFTEFSCVGCHEHAQARVDGIHAGIARYRYDSASCLSCHPNGIADVGGVDDATHTRDYFPIDDASAHATDRKSVV